MKRGEKRALLIAGPTASGKSALALAFAKANGGLIVNADALQVYGVLSVLTARPGDADMQAAPHRLYGFVDPALRFSTGAWLAAAESIVAKSAGQPLIFVGGTGLYFEALERGFAEVPPVPTEIVAEVEAEIAGLDATARGRLIAARDPLIAARLKAPDPQRVTRALAVLKATGRSLASFQDQPQRGLLDDFVVERIVLNPPREIVGQRIAARFETMFERGAVAEVESLLRLALDPSLPAMKAIGVPEIAAWLGGTMSQGKAIEKAIIATRQFAKRQRTWFRARMTDWQWRDPTDVT